MCRPSSRPPYAQGDRGTALCVGAHATKHASEIDAHTDQRTGREHVVRSTSKRAPLGLTTLAPHDQRTEIFRARDTASSSEPLETGFVR